MKKFDALVTKIHPVESFFAATNIYGRLYKGEVMAKNSHQAKTKFISRILRELGIRDERMGIEISKALPYTRIIAASTVSAKVPIKQPSPTLIQPNLNL